MPRVHSQVARQDIYAQGKMIPDAKTKSGKRLDRSQPANKQDTIIVKKGQTYYWWKFRYGGKRISTTRPKPSQLTQSDFLSQIYSIGERLEDVSNELTSPEDVESVKDEIVGELEQLRDEQEEKRNNMPDSLQDGSVGELLQERYDAVDEMINELEGIDVDYEELDESEREEGTSDEDWEEQKQQHQQEWLDEKATEMSSVSYNGS